MKKLKVTKDTFQIGFTENHIRISDYKISSNTKWQQKKEYSALQIHMSIDFC
jgi:hypothetical protein